MNDEIMTVAQTAKYLKIGDKTVLRLISDQRLLASKVGRIWRIKLSDINTYLATNSNEKKGGR